MGEKRDLPNSALMFRDVGAKPDPALIRSVAEHGVLAPITVVKMPGEHYLVVDGRRRTEAACMAGLETVPAIVLGEYPDRPYDPVVSLTLNGHRRPNPWSEYMSIKALMDGGMTMEAVAKVTHWPVTTVRRRLLYSRLVPSGQALTSVGIMGPAAAERLARLPQAQQTELLDRLTAEGKTITLRAITEHRAQARVRADEQLPDEVFAPEAQDGGNDLLSRYRQALGAALALIDPDDGTAILLEYGVETKAQVFQSDFDPDDGDAED